MGGFGGYRNGLSYGGYAFPIQERNGDKTPKKQIIIVKKMLLHKATKKHIKVNCTSKNAAIVQKIKENLQFLCKKTKKTAKNLTNYILYVRIK